METVEKRVIAGAGGLIPAVVHLPVLRPAPTVVCCHGLLSSKDSSKWVGLGQELGRRGYAALRFDFAGCGESTAGVGPSLLGARLAELHTVLDYVSGRSWCNGRIGLLGSSLGGYLALLAASAKGAAVGATVCWATPFSLSRARRALDALAVTKDHPLAGLPLGSPEDLGGVGPVAGVLIVHGTRDEVVPWMDALAIHDRMAEPKRLILLEHADHRLSDVECRTFAVRGSLAWYDRHLR